MLEAPVKRGWGLNRSFALEDEDDVLDYEEYQETPTESSEGPLQEHKAENGVSNELTTIVSENHKLSAKEMSDTQIVEELDPMRQHIDALSTGDFTQDPQAEVNDNREPTVGQHTDTLSIGDFTKGPHVEVNGNREVTAVAIKSNYVHYTSRKSKSYSPVGPKSRYEARLIKEDLLEPVMRWRTDASATGYQMKIVAQALSRYNPTLGTALQDRWATLTYSQRTAYPLAREIIRTYSLRKTSHLEPWLATSIRFRKIYLRGPFTDVLSSYEALVFFCRDSQFNTEVLKKFRLDYNSYTAFVLALGKGQTVITNIYSRNHLLRAELQMFKFRKKFFRYFSFVKRTRGLIQVWYADKTWQDKDTAYSYTFNMILADYSKMLGDHWTEIYQRFIELEEYRAQKLLSQTARVAPLDYRDLSRRMKVIERL